MKQKLLIIISILLIGTMAYACLPGQGLWTANAAVPRLINYQARLTDKQGQPLEGRHSITFRIYDVENGGSHLWEEIRGGDGDEENKIDINKGIVSVMLGDKTSLDLPFDEKYYLEIIVDGEVMSPRQRITSVGYAFKAESANTAVEAINASTVAGYSVSGAATAGKIPVMNTKGYLPEGSVNTTALKTAIGTVSYTGIFGIVGANRTLPGGIYGFYPQIKNGDGGTNSFTYINGLYGYNIGISSTSYVTNIFLGPSHETAQTQYARQCYITASGIDYWLFVLTDKQTKKIISVWGAPDHPAYGNGGDFEALAHPFKGFDEENQEISLICNDSIEELRANVTKDRDIVDLVNEEYKVDFSQTLEYEPLHSGQFLEEKPVLVETIPDYITVRKLVKLTLAEKRAKEEETEQLIREYEEQKARDEQKRQAAVSKLGALGLTEEDIKLIMKD